MSSTSTAEHFNPLAAASPPNPPPTITTTGAFVVISSLSDLQSRDSNVVSECAYSKRSTCHSLPGPGGQAVRVFQPKSSNHILPKQSHVPVRWRSWAFLPGCGHRKQSGGPTLYGFAGIKSRRPFLEESSKRLTSVHRAHSLAKLHHLVLGSLFYTGPNLTAQKLFRRFECS